MHSPVPERHQVFRIFHYFSIISFVCVVVAAASLAAFFRYVAIREIVEFGEYTNAVLAEASLNAVRPATLLFLAQTSQMEPDKLASLPVPALLEKEIYDLMGVHSVVRVKIYNQYGWVAYSSNRTLIGGNQSDNPGVRAALAGHITSNLVYRDAFNAFERNTEDDNLIQTYVPIAAAANEPVRGVFEIYVDVNSRVADSQRAQWQIIGAAAAIMAVLYFSLLAVVRYAEKTIDQQQTQIRSHTRTLEVLSARMLQQQENEKKKIAFDLHEGIAQTLSAVKMSVEAACKQLAAQSPGQPVAMEPMVQAVKEAITEVRSVALHLRPSSLDDLGLVATVRWFCREFSERHPNVQAESEISLLDEAVPDPLKVIIYRVIEEACRSIDQLTGITRVRVVLQAEDNRIALTIEHDWSKELSTTPGDDSTLDIARERTLLSGGSFKVAPNPWGGRSLQATWLA